MNVDVLLARLDRVRQTAPNQWQARCPAHDDRNPSLSIGLGDDGRILITDFAGCERQSILDAVDLTFADLFTARGNTPPRITTARLDFGAAWDVAIPCEIHPYLTRKRVRSYGLRQDSEGLLLIPMRDVDGKIQALQRIWPDGDKRHMKGSKVRGHFFQIGEVGGPGKLSTNLIICEGYATGASIYEALGWLTIVAFASGNLAPVAKNLRCIYQRQKFVFAADNDRDKEGNPGITKATAAARRHGGIAVWPQFRVGDAGTDWNDAEGLYGMDAVEQIYEF